MLVVLHVWLNFLCSYALAYRVTRHTAGALVAALVFGASPFVAAHLTGHFNLIAAWVVPLVCLLAWHASERVSMRAGAWFGRRSRASRTWTTTSSSLRASWWRLRWLAQCSTITWRIRTAAPTRRRRALIGIAVLLAWM